MNIGLITSYVIAGILLLSILAMNMSLSQSSNELTLSQITGQHVNTISEMVTHDIPKIGYDLTKKINNPIIKADSTEIIFESNIDNTGGIEEVSWLFTSNPVGSSENPNDYILRRRIKAKSTGTIKESTDITLGVTNFRIRYYNEYGGTTPMSTPVTGASLNNIKQIEIILMVESRQPMGGLWGADETYVRSAWEKRFSPANLEEIN